jgi:Family of unknown function (DUF6338)
VPDTFVSLVVAVAAVLPGFVTVELTQRRRAVQVGAGVQSAVLRALFYALLIHLAWSWWTWILVEDLTGPNWNEHLGETVAWASVVLVASPVVIGLPLNRVLREAESRGVLSWWHYALGGRDSRDAWDLIFQRAAVRGAWVLVHLRGDTPEAPRVVIGQYGEQSAAGQSPAQHDVFLERMWSVDMLGRPVAELDPPRGMWVAKEGIAELYFLDGDPTIGTS